MSCIMGEWEDVSVAPEKQKQQRKQKALKKPGWHTVRKIVLNEASGWVFFVPQTFSSWLEENNDKEIDGL